MKIRNKHLVRLAGKAVSLVARGLVGTMRYDYLPLALPLGPFHLKPDNRDRYIYAMWHENLLLPAARFGDASLAVLISKHADGQILGALAEAMGMGLVQGSTNRGGVEAVRKLLHDPNARRHLAITPDGPRGPRRVVQPGIVYIASRTGMKIVCIGVGYQNAWRAKSWDRFAIPKPASRGKFITAEPIAVPADLKMDQLEGYRQFVQSEMDRLNGLAEQYAATNRPPVAGRPILRRAA